VKHELDVDAYLADGGTLMDLGIIDSFGNIRRTILSGRV
jgi:hypothetical protein